MVRQSSLQGDESIESLTQEDVIALYLKYRPQSFSEIIGHEQIVKILSQKVESKTVPNTILFSGDTGVGKTTTARILSRELGCTEFNLTQVNCADFRSIDDVRGIREVMHLHPMGGGCKVWILEECVQLPKVTQQAFLAILEDTPKYVYFLLCSSDLSGLLPTFVGRCFHLALQPLLKAQLADIMDTVCAGEGRKIEPEVKLAIATAANGSARMALQLLEAALVWKDPENQLQAIGSCKLQSEESEQFLGRALFSRSSWGMISKIINNLEDKDVEGVRRQVLGYAAKVLSSPNGHGQEGAYKVIKALSEPFFGSGKAGLLAAVYSVYGKTQG